MVVDGPLHGTHVQAGGAALRRVRPVAERAGGTDQGPRADEHDGGRVEQVDERGDRPAQCLSGAVEDRVDDTARGGRVAVLDGGFEVSVEPFLREGPGDGVRGCRAFQATVALAAALDLVAVVADLDGDVAQLPGHPVGTAEHPPVEDEGRADAPVGDQDDGHALVVGPPEEPLADGEGVRVVVQDDGDVEALLHQGGQREPAPAGVRRVHDRAAVHMPADAHAHPDQVLPLGTQGRVQFVDEVEDARQHLRLVQVGQW
ncbi:hypothetical protein GCM10010365_55000 [Streptomyces poonensis]|uniref:Uncharacterized protein n=1 Tax=Streptomyces poonensis TaxID=68255 RepID=A0A918Q025_9ACTN|nr:hypothetical protein GCM10010365_55000 [Streptomyces poonensis]GLJ89730.1 hypothetical protein GCM10017589_23310 [Streptomyces poonensis]